MEALEGFMGSGNSTNDAGGAYTYYGGDPEVLKSLGLAHLLVLFWMTDHPVVKIDEEGLDYYELRNDPKGYQIIGCDPEETRQLLRYRSHVAASTPVRLYFSRKAKLKNKGVIGRQYLGWAPEMSPNISYYSQDEYPHRDFALSCGILSSFCFPLVKYGCGVGVMEIVSTCNQDAGALRNFCESIKGFTWSFIFPLLNVQHDAVPKINHLLDGVCQTLHLPLAQYGILKHSGYTLVHQFSHRDFENLAPWCQFKDAYFHKRIMIGQCPLARYSKSEAFFCRDIAALNVTEYYFAHYAQECGSISCFTIYLRDLPPLHNKYILEFFLLLPQEIGNGYPHPLLNSIWATIKECLPNYMFYSKKRLAKVLSVKVIKSSSLSEPKSFKIGKHNSSLPHHEGSIQRSSLNFYEEVGEMSSRIPIEAPQHEKSKERLEIEGNTGAVERVSEPVEEATIEDAGYATVNELEESLNKCIEPQSLASQPRRSEEIFRDEGYPVASGRVDNFVVSPDEDVEYDVIPASKRLKKSKIPFTIENIRKYFGRPLKDAAESFGVSLSTFKRRCRAVGISWWEPSKSKRISGEPGRKKKSSDMPNLSKRSVAHASQDINTMTVKVIYNNDNIRFELPSSSGIAELENSVIERLPLDRKSFTLKYQDDEGDWILIGCDNDVQECMKISRLLKKTTIKMLLGPPISNYVL